jgi:hypothetical protein
VAVLAVTHLRGEKECFDAYRICIQDVGYLLDVYCIGYFVDVYHVQFIGYV